MRKRTRGSKHETDSGCICPLEDCGFKSTTQFGIEQHLQMRHTRPEDMLQEVLGDPIMQCSDPVFEIAHDVELSEESAEDVEQIHFEENVSLQSEESHGSDLIEENELADTESNQDQCDENLSENNEFYTNFDLSVVSSEDLKFFKLSKIALNNGWSQATLTDVLEYQREMDLNCNWKKSARAHWDCFDRLCFKYGFKEKDQYEQKEISLQDAFDIREKLTFKYVKPRRAVIRLLRSMDWTRFDFLPTVNPIPLEDFESFFQVIGLVLQNLL